jgi:hypothetical protein
MSNTGLLRDRIRAGAAYLDANEPGWRDNVVVVDLDLSDCCRCVLGQVFTPDVAAELARPNHDSILDEMNSGNTEARSYGWFNGYQYATGDWEGAFLTDEACRDLAFDAPGWALDPDATDPNEDHWLEPVYDYEDMTHEWRSYLKGEWT